ncbi:MAG: helix-turn-helix transcriptional regulator [Chitinophagaceae bacterium]|nr:helix-turn-helix transcriptional regulator [Chitinophagaceae bacterium]
MVSTDINRLKVILAEEKVTNKWLAEQLGVAPNTVSSWVRNAKQPSIQTFVQISHILKVDIREFFTPTYPTKK